MTPDLWEPRPCGSWPHRDLPRRSICVAGSRPGGPRICLCQRPEGGREVMAEPKVVMYSTSWCPFCARARSLLERKGTQFEIIDIDERPEARAEMTARSGRH